MNKLWFKLMNIMGQSLNIIFFKDHDLGVMETDIGEATRYRNASILNNN